MKKNPIPFKCRDKTHTRKRPFVCSCGLLTTHTRHTNDETMGGAQGRATAVVVSSFLSLGSPPLVVFAAAAARCVGGRRAARTRALAAESALKGRCWLSSTSTSTSTHETTTTTKKSPPLPLPLPPSKVDVAIVGGGLVGVAFARALRTNAMTKHLSVAVLDGNPRAFALKREKKGNDEQHQQPRAAPKARVSALTPESIEFLERECGGVWTQIEKTNLGNEFDAVQAWDAIGEGYVRFEAKEANRNRLGVVVENDATRNALCDGLVEEFEEEEEEEEEKGGQESAKKRKRNLFLLPGTSVVGTETTESSPFRVVKFKSSLGNSGDKESDEEVKTISARLVVGADGPNGAMKRFAGVRSFGYDYNQKAVCGTVELDGPTKTAFQRFLKNGPIALLPIGNGKTKTSDDDSQFPIYANIVWSTTPKEAERITALSDDDFASEVNDAIHGGREYNYQLRKQQVRDSKIIKGGFAKSFSMFVAESFAKDVFSFAMDTLTKNKKMENKVREIFESTLNENEFEPPPNIIATAKGSERGAFPLKLKIAGARTHRRMLLIGDAAHVVHPLGGQGVNLGFKDVAAGIDAIENAVSVGDDIGSENTLRNYKNARFLEMSAMVIGLDALQKIFGPTLSSIEPFTQLRSIGMRAVNMFAPVRETITKFAADGGVLRKK